MTKNDIVKAQKNGVLKKYGVENVSCIKEVRKKAIETWKKNTGLDNPYDDQNLKEKRKRTCIDRYGCENPTQSDNIKQKIKQTNIEKYGATAPFQNELIREKFKQDYFEKTGYFNPSQNPDVQNKIKENNMKKYGVANKKQINFSETAKKVLSSKDSFEEYLQSCNLSSTHDIANNLCVSESTIVKYIAKFGLYEYIKSNISSGENEVLQFILSLGINARRDRCKILPHNEIDIYCPDYNIAIEYNGLYWHSDIIQSSKFYHYQKSKLCAEKGIRLIHIYEDEWNDPVKKEIIKSLIKISLGKVESKIYARQCEIREITNKEARPFNDANHIQGHRNAKITYGLFYKNKLVQLMSFSWNSHYDAWEIIRGCPGSNNIVVGGVSKLFKHFIKENNPDKIFSYCDFNKFNGSGYEAIGMEYIGETKYNKWYVFDNKRHERNPSKYKLYNEVKECIIYGAGSKKYLWTNPNKNNQNNN